MHLDPATPIIVGVGTASQRDGALEPVALMAHALRQAAGDTSVPGMLEAADLLLCPQGTWAYRNAPGAVARLVGAASAHTVLTHLGILQQSLFDRAYNAVASGEVGVALVVGGEAKYRALQAAIAGTDLPEQTDVDTDPDEVIAPAPGIVSGPEIAAGLIDAVSQYALIENAARAAAGWSIDEHRRLVAERWSAFNRIARDYPEAWNPAPMTADEIREPALSNKPLAFPYNKWHNSQWNIDLASGFVICSVETARAHGVPEDLWVFPHACTESDNVVPVSEREHVATSPGVRIAGGAALDLAGVAPAGLDHVDLYSCFPVAVRVQAAELGLDPERDLTITGGMAFAGGPFNNYVLQSTAAMARRLRAEPGTVGLISAISGMITKQGYGVYSTSAPADGYRFADLTDEVAAATGRVTVHDSHSGPARVVTYTVRYDSMDPAKVIAVCGLDDGSRVIATSDDAALAARWTTDDPIGSEVRVEGTALI